MLVQDRARLGGCREARVAHERTAEVEGADLANGSCPGIPLAIRSRSRPAWALPKRQRMREAQTHRRQARDEMVGQS